MRLTRKTNLALSTFAGALVPLALAPVSLWPLSPLSIILFWLSLQSCTSSRQASLTGFVYGLGYFGVGVSWVFVSMVDHSNTHWALAGLLTLLFCAGLGLFYAIFAALFHRFKHLHHYPSLLFLGLWVSLDLLRGWLLTGFPWLYLGYASIDTSLAGYAPLLGIHGVTLLLVASGLLVHGVAITKPYRLLLLAAIWLAGYGLSLIQWTQPSTPAPIKVTLLQGNIGLQDKWLPQHLTPTLNYYLGQTYQHLDSDLIVWPETAIATYWDYIQPSMQAVSLAATTHNSQIISGTVMRENQNQGANYFNSLVVLGPQDGSTEPPAQGYYHKQRLVPFGEYIPLEQWFRGAIDFFDLPMSAFKIPTQEQGLLSHSPVPIAGNICYEIAYPQLVAKQASAAQMIVTVSNDTWFEHSLAPWQHLQIAQMRAIENAKPVARATNSGVSALIDAKGKIIALAPMYQQAQLTGLVGPKQGTTPYNIGLNWPITLLSLGLILFGFRFGFGRNFMGLLPHRFKP